HVCSHRMSVLSVPQALTPALPPLAQVLAALAVSLGPFAAGLGKGYSSPAIASLQEQQAAAEEIVARFPGGRLPAGLNGSA
ncbi:Sugar transporter, putative, partial [Gryllus bimaculatus]